MDEHSIELKKCVEALIDRISLNGYKLNVVNINYGAFEQIFNAYAAVKLRRIATMPGIEDVKDELHDYANAVEKGFI